MAIFQHYRYTSSVEEFGVECNIFDTSTAICAERPHADSACVGVMVLRAGKGITELDALKAII